MSEKSYSNCPLKKRPVQVIDHNNFESDVEDEEIRPVDLSVPRRYNLYLRRHSSESEKQSPSTCSSDYTRIFVQPLSLSKISYPADSVYLIKSEDFLGSPVSVRGNSISPHSFHYLEDNQQYHQLYLNHNNNIIKDEINQTDERPMISPALSHLSYSSIQSDQLSSRYSEPEDLSVKIDSKPEPLNKSTDSNQTDLTTCESDRGLYYQCSICKKSYSTAAGLIKHEQSHSLPQDLSKSKSSECSVIMKTSDPNVEYNSINHGTPRYQCSECGKSYSTYSGLTKHKQFHCPASERNKSKKMFSCKNCDKVYVSLGALKMHIRTHTLPCKCPLCGKAFSRPWLLQGHIRTHTGEKPFSCQHCHRAFADRSNLRAHLQTHSDVKRYSCSTCSKTFSRMSLLGKHLQGGCPTNSVNQRNEIIQSNCDYSSIANQPIFYKSTAPTSFPALRNLDFPVHQNYADANRQQYEENIHAF